jgi:dGTP triphosphohydrolase
MAYIAATPLTDDQEKLLRYRMIVDYVSGLTDQHALALHQLFTGSSL